MDPRIFLVQAGDLLEDFQPVDCRTAISRSYYAAYLVAREFLEEMGATIPSGPGSHGKVHNLMLFSKDQTVIEMGSILKDLSSHRTDADYKMQNRTVEKHSFAKDWREHAETIIKAIDGIHDTAQRHRLKSIITSASKNYKYS